MSVLSKADIRARINNGNIYLSPILSAEQLGPVSVDLRLGNVVLIVRARDLSHVNPEAYKAAEQDGGHDKEKGFRQKFERYDLLFKDPFLLHPGTLALVPTLEWLRLPGNLKGVVTARSSWAREGLNIATANFINPHYNGIITLELANFGEIPIAIYPGMRVAQIAFHQLSRAVPDGSDPSQFDLSFEPQQGKITKGDEPFIPTSGFPL